MQLSPDLDEEMAFVAIDADDETAKYKVSG